MSNFDQSATSASLAKSPAEKSHSAQSYSAEGLASALEAAGMCGWDWDMLSGRDRFFGDWQTIFGTNPTGHYEDFRRLLHPDDIDRVEREIEIASKSSEISVYDFRVIRPDGQLRWIRGQARFFHDDQGKPIRMVGVDFDITEQRLATLELENQRALLQSIVDNIPVLLCYMKEPGRVHWVNRTWEQTLGWSVTDNGGFLTPLLYPSSTDANKVQEFIAKADTEWGEFSTRTKWGTVLDTAFRNVLLPDGTNIGIGQDVSDRKRAEKELRESEERFRATFEQAAVGLAHVAPDGKWLRLNQRMCDIFGYSKEELLQRTYKDITHPDDLDEDVSQAESLLEGPTDNYRMQKRYIRKDGQVIWGQLTVRLLRNADGTPKHYISVVEDITQQKLAEQEMLRSREQLQAMISTIPQIVWMCLPDGSIDFISDNFYEYTGLPRSAPLAENWEKTIHPDDRNATLSGLQDVLSSGKAYEHEHRLRRADGEFRWFLARGVAMRDPATGEITKWLGTTTDIHDQKIAHEALRKAEKLAAVGRMAASISHEINNPLESVTNLLYLLESAENIEQTKRYARMAQQELARVSQVAMQTLQFHRQTTAPTSCRLSETMESVLRLFKGRFVTYRIEVEKDYQDEPVRCLESELRQVFANFVGNATDAMAATGGRLRVRVRTGCDPKTMRRGVVVLVADTGSGIPEETRKHIFEAFFTTKGERGTGLGLWVANGIVEKHQGKIALRSSTDRQKHGTIFKLFVPFENSVMAESSQKP